MFKDFCFKKIPTYFYLPVFTVFKVYKVIKNLRTQIMIQEPRMRMGLFRFASACKVRTEEFRYLTEKCIIFVKLEPIVKLKHLFKVAVWCKIKIFHVFVLPFESQLILKTVQPLKKKHPADFWHLENEPFQKLHYSEVTFLLPSNPS